MASKFLMNRVWRDWKGLLWAFTTAGSSDGPADVFLVSGKDEAALKEARRNPRFLYAMDASSSRFSADDGALGTSFYLGCGWAEEYEQAPFVRLIFKVRQFEEVEG